MAIDYDKLMNWPFPDLVHTYTARDTALYALGAGCGADPLDTADLRFVYEQAKNFAALPTMAVVLGYPGFWLQDPKTGADWKKVLHGEQSLTLHKPLPTSGTVIGRTRVDEIVDKGAGKGALLTSTREIVDKATGTLLASVKSLSFMRGDGGFGGPAKPSPKPHAIPDRKPDHSVDTPTSLRQALIYRLSGDYNPLHADPAVAKSAGFERPILHGLSTYAVAGRAVLKACCGGDPAKLKRFDVRFSAPVYPGETVQTQIWRDKNVVSFRCRIPARDIIVLDNGRAEISG
jgi:acyl dehydratase